MNKRCARCEKTVYPTEELKCLDQSWHKGCFKCQVCNMTLSMKNYKGFDKKPYCNAHYPTQRPTVVADTPESRRIAENTKIQSNVKYHADFEKQKGKKITVAEDPEVMRIKQNTQIQSNVHYKQVREQLQEMEHRRPAEPISPTVDNSSSARRVGSISDYDPMNDRYGSIAGQYTGGQRTNKAPQQPSNVQPPPQAQQGKDRFAGKGMVCQAVYDYTAADSDEVTFAENDTIIYCQPIDAGWMEGTVERTGQRGMLPANYVEQVH